MQNKRSLVQLLHLLQLSDSALPVGGFSFSNALESAVQYGVVSDADTLFRYTASAMQFAVCFVGYDTAKKQNTRYLLQFQKLMLKIF